uniref:Uncharacterized protein n=1 Tax=uncultured bacterium esnapd2 TaxID=1366601 RepID=S5TLV1_9BACT|nr:hypothetical protein [uncultured bacterium esnapd2]
MGISEALTVLSRQWREIHVELEPGAAASLDALVKRLANEPHPVLAEECAHQIADLLSRSLSQDHPFRRALAGTTRRSLAAVHDPDTLLEWLQLTESLGAQVELPYPRLEEVATRAAEWLLAEPALSAREVSASGQDPYAPFLIRLERPDGGEQWPAFQFSPDGSPWAVVREINQILDAEDDPWGVADWWLGENHLAGAIPARLIGEIDDATLIELALDERSEV